MNGAGWTEKCFLSGIKNHILYGEKDRMVLELGNGDCLIAEVRPAGNGIGLAVFYRHKGSGTSSQDTVMGWFPSDDELLEAIHRIYVQERWGDDGILG